MAAGKRFIVKISVTNRTIVGYAYSIGRKYFFTQRSIVFIARFGSFSDFFKRVISGYALIAG